MILRKYKNLLLFIAIFCVTIISFSPLFNAHFLDWDDKDYILNNLSIQTLSIHNIKLYFVNTYLGNYHPLTMLSYSIDYFIGNGSPIIFHTTNIILHIFNTYIVYIIVAIISKDKIIAIVTCVLFSINPLSVESVGWIAERKNLLYTFFFLLSTLYFIKYIIQKNKTFYWLCLLFFIFSLLSKGQAVTLPFTLIGIFWIINKQFYTKQLFLNLTPFFILSIIFGIVAIKSQYSDGYINSNINTTTFDKISIACYSYITYFKKIILPINLSAFYPFPKIIDYHISLYIIPSITIICVFFYSIKKQYYLSSALILIFTSNIIFVLQIIPLGGHIYADRYTYIPSICIYIMMGLIMNKFFTSYEKKYVYVIFMLITISGCYLTYNRSKVFQNSYSLYKNVLNEFPDDEITLNSMAVLMTEKGDYQTALLYNNKSIQSDSKYFQAYYNRAIIHYKLGDDNKAIEDYKKCISIEPQYYYAYYGIAEILIKQKKYDKAIEQLNYVINIKNDYKKAYYFLGLCYTFIKDNKRAILNYNTAQKLGFESDLLFINRAIAFGQQGDFKFALTDLNNALIINPNSAQSFYLRGIAKVQLGIDGCDDLSNAQRLHFLNSDKAYNYYCN